MPYLRGIVLKTLSALLFTVMGGLIKAASADVPTGQVMFARNFFALVPILIMLRAQGPIREAIRTERLSGHVLRGLIGCFGMYCGFSALARMPLPDATAIHYSAPIFSVVLSALILRETVRIYRWSAVGVGFLGILIMLGPQLLGEGGGKDEVWATGAAFGLGAAGATAFAVIQVRRLTTTETTGAIVFYFSILATLASLFTLPFETWVVPTAPVAVMLVMTGIAGGIGQALLTHSYRFAPASIIAPFDYTTMLWSVLIGYFAFSEVPTVSVLYGAVLVIGAGIFVIWREARLGIDRSKQKRVRTPWGG